MRTPAAGNALITRIEGKTSGLRVTVKDLIDVAGYPTTAGCHTIADEADAAPHDAACLAGARDAERRGTACLVGKANLHELAAGPTGVNPWFGTPVNPRDPSLVPGGSSSGSAAGVGAGEADVSYGTDTGGSIRIPSACCGTTGLKTTWGRIPVTGVLPMAPSFDVVGPMARDIAGVVAGMRLLEPSFTMTEAPAGIVGRLRLPDVDPRVDEAIDAALRKSELEVIEVSPAGWDAAQDAAVTLICAEAYRENQELLSRSGDRIGADVRQLLERGTLITGVALQDAQRARELWTAHLGTLFARVHVLALPVLRSFPPRLEQADLMYGLACTSPISLAGLPALAQPVPAAGAPVSAALQLVGPAGAEALLLSTGALVERAVSR